MKDGQKVQVGQTLVEWDPYTFSILTEDMGTVKFKDLIEGLTVHEEAEEVTGMSRYIIVDSPDGKKQPTIEIRDVELFEARKPRDPAVISEIDGLVKDGGVVKGQRKMINDKHGEVIARQMMRWVKIEDAGDTEFLIDEQADKFRFAVQRSSAENEPE